MTFDQVPPSPAHPLQNLVELGALWSLVAAGPHRRVIEVGSLFGGTLWYWSHLPSIELLITVDQPTTWPGVAEQAAEARTHWPEWFDRCEFVDHSTSSQDPATFLAVAGRAPFDFAFIDGDHSYEGAAADVETYAPLVRPGGLLALHDTWPNHDRHEPGVVRLVDELRHRWPATEWTDPDGVGITAFVMP